MQIIISAKDQESPVSMLFSGGLFSARSCSPQSLGHAVMVGSHAQEPHASPAVRGWSHGSLCGTSCLSSLAMGHSFSSWSVAILGGGNPLT